MNRSCFTQQVKQMSKYSEIEAILFVVGDEGIGLEELSYLVNSKTAAVYQYLQELNQRYEENEDSALHILEVGNHLFCPQRKKSHRY